MHPSGGNMQPSGGNMQLSGGITVYLKYTTIFPFRRPDPRYITQAACRQCAFYTIVKYAKF